MRNKSLVAACCLFAIVGLHGSLRAQTVSFYQGKTITFIVGTSPGAGYDLYGRTFARFLSAHLAGSPTIIVQNMPAADGLALANLVYNVSPKDGTVLALSPAAIALSEILQPGKFSYRTRNLNWVGTLTTMTDVLAVFKESGITNVDDAKAKNVAIGAGGTVGPLSIYPTLANAFLGTKFEIIHGYPGGNEINMAMENNEVQGRDNQWNSWLEQRPKWIADHKLNYLLQFGPKVEELGNVPEFEEVIPAGEDRNIADFVETMQFIGRSIYTTPDLPPERLAELRKAFNDVMKDPDYVSEMKKLGLDMHYRSGEELQAQLLETMAKANEVGPQLMKVLNLQ